MNWYGKSNSRTNKKVVEGKGTLDQHVESGVARLVSRLQSRAASGATPDVFCLVRML